MYDFEKEYEVFRPEKTFVVRFHNLEFHDGDPDTVDRDVAVFGFDGLEIPKACVPYSVAEEFNNLEERFREEAREAYIEWAQDAHVG